MRHRGPLRLTVSGMDEPVLLAPDDVAAGDGVSAQVRHRSATPEDQSMGRRRYQVTVDGWVFDVAVESEARAALRERAGHGTARQGQAGVQTIRAQIPGRVVRLWVVEGDTVEAGQPLLAIEAMKMENEVRSPRAGSVEAIKVAVGGSVELGDELLTVR